MAFNQNSEWDLTALVLFSINIVGLFYLSALDIAAGAFYFSLALLFPALFFLSYFFIGGVKGTFQRLPIKKSTVAGTQMFLVGFLIVVIIKTIGVATEKILAPKFLFSQQLFQAFAIGESRFWDFFITSFSAGIMEELVFGFVFVIVGMAIAVFIQKLIPSLDFGERGNYWFRVLVGCAFSIVPFVLFHSFNPTYTTSMFLFAGIFRFVMNLVIWSFGGITFGIGYHIANNMLTLGGAVIFGALLSPFGLIILALFVLMLYNLIKKWREIDTSFGFKDVF